jgi:hypothetical protein
MEGIDQITEELEQKSIERVVVDVDDTEEEDSNLYPVSQVEKKPAPKGREKKPRSEAQKAAFAKAMETRQKNIKARATLKEEEKIARKTKIKEIVQKDETTSNLEPLKKPSVQPLHREAAISPPEGQQSKPRHEQVVNNYYYYGHADPYISDEAKQVAKQQKKKKTKKKRPPTPEPSSSEESSEEEEQLTPRPERPRSPPVEPQSYKELQEYEEEPAHVPVPKQNARYKFNFK